MNYLVEPFTSNEFMLLALVAGGLVSITCAIAGTFVVLRGLAFVGDALAHGVLPGIALAVLLGFSGVLGAAIGAGVMMGGVGLVQRRLRLSGDTAVGLLFVGMLALGVIITSRSDAFVGDLLESCSGNSSVSIRPISHGRSSHSSSLRQPRSSVGDPSSSSRSTMGSHVPRGFPFDSSTTCS